jgi:hypothetical protein
MVLIEFTGAVADTRTSGRPEGGPSMSVRTRGTVATTRRFVYAKQSSSIPAGERPSEWGSQVSRQECRNQPASNDRVGIVSGHRSDDY